MRKIRDIDLGRFHRPHGIALTSPATVCSPLPNGRSD